MQDAMAAATSPGREAAGSDMGTAGALGSRSASTDERTNTMKSMPQPPPTHTPRTPHWRGVTLVQELASRCGHTLLVQNLSLQTDAADLLGG